MPRSPLETSIEALTESLVDSVMDAIRNAPLEDLLAGGVRLEPVERAATLPRARPRGASPTKTTADPSSAGVARVSPTDASPIDEITDPQLVLGLDEPLAKDHEPERPLESEAPASSPRMRLRDNETLARFSNAGVVIRRAR